MASSSYIVLPARRRGPFRADSGRRRWTATIAPAVICLVALTVFVLIGTTGTADVALRAPFALQIPDAGNMTIVAPEARVPGTAIHQLRLMIKAPYSDDIDYGKIYTAVNGESANLIAAKRSSSNGKMVVLDLDRNSRFQLKPGKNVVEISATDHNQRSFYASFVLLVGGQPDRTDEAGVSIDRIAADNKSDDQAPIVCLSEPGGAVAFSGRPYRLMVRGTVAPESGRITSLTVNGEAVSLTQASGSRALIHNPCAEGQDLPWAQFSRELSIASADHPIVIEAKDSAGNLCRVTIPVTAGSGPPAPQFRGRKYAAIIGVSRYKYLDAGLNNLQFADADARAIRDFLKRKEGGGFADSDILYMENEQATVDAVRDALTRFLQRANEDDLVFLFIAGHGSPDPYSPSNLYLIMHDTKVADMSTSALPMADLEDVLTHTLRAKRVVAFIDTCHSAGISEDRKLTLTPSAGVENNVVNLYAARLFGETGRAVITSSDVNEVSRESREWGGGHGVFTMALLEGLAGAADSNKDHVVTAGELFEYVRNRVRLATAGQQNPKAVLGLNGDLPLAYTGTK
ncbi:MAG TPA: caspase family protein [Blastocatellia bacterium]